MITLYWRDDRIVRWMFLPFSGLLRMIAGERWYWIGLWAWIALAVPVFLVLLKVPAPYGRTVRRGWGPLVSARAGWLIMESPAVVLFAGFFCYFRAAGFDGNSLAVSLVFVGSWEAHYVQRGLVYPFRLRGGKGKMTLSVVTMALVFNILNAYFNTAYLFVIRPIVGLEWLHGWRFIAGCLLFVCGAAINLRSDAMLRRLRSGDNCQYTVPKGFLFEYVSCPNYLGEIIEWIGWAVLTWSPAGLSFAVWTAANLVPRALHYHRWYRATFSYYPRGRKAILPFVL